MTKKLKNIPDIVMIISSSPYNSQILLNFKVTKNSGKNIKKKKNVINLLCLFSKLILKIISKVIDTTKINKKYF